MPLNYIQNNQQNGYPVLISPPSNGVDSSPMRSYYAPPQLSSSQALSRQKTVVPQFDQSVSPISNRIHIRGLNSFTLHPGILK